MMALHDAYTPAEDAVIRDCWQNMNSREIATLLPGRSPCGVARRARRLELDAGLRAGANSRLWTVEDDKRLARMDSQGCSIDFMAEHLERSRESIKQHRREIGLPPICPRLTPGQVEIIRQYVVAGYPHRIAAQAAGCSRSGVVGVCKRLGISNGLKPGRSRLDASWGWDECGMMPVEASA